MAEMVFWFSTALILFVYAGYPATLWALSRFTRKPVSRSGIEPPVSIIIAAYNEEAVIGETIINKMKLDYPREKIEIIVVSDGSTDQTDDVVRSIEGPVRLISLSTRRGKTSALNTAVRQAKGDLVIFSDANSHYHPAALRHLVSNFADPSVGYVTGRMVYRDSADSLTGAGCGAYMRFENRIRMLETRLGSIVGVNGGVDAVRRVLYEEMPDEALPDFVLPLAVVRKGYRVVFDEHALLMEDALSEVRDEWRMRVRVILRSFHALWRARDLLNPFRHRFFSFQLFSHKVLRYLVGFAQAGALAGAVMLAPAHRFYMAALAAQLLFYSLAAIGHRRRKASLQRSPADYAYYFCLLNAAAMAAFVKFLQGRQQVVWEPRKGD